MTLTKAAACRKKKANEKRLRREKAETKMARQYRREIRRRPITSDSFIEIRRPIMSDSFIEPISRAYYAALLALHASLCVNPKISPVD
jgi:hypothetical protein